LAEATFKALAPAGMQAMSAGSKPTGLDLNRFKTPVALAQQLEKIGQLS